MRVPARRQIGNAQKAFRAERFCDRAGNKPGRNRADFSAGAEILARDGVRRGRWSAVTQKIRQTVLRVSWNFAA
jgi:hypothetical protein